VRLGRYEILGRLAVGGMAEILLGRVRGPHGFERPVAIKRILPHLVENRAFVDMFVDEARIAASVRHARVVQVHELAELDGEYFLVMEYIEGESVGGLMRRLWLSGEPLDRALAAHIVAEACAGLHAAHELTDAGGGGREVVHRDVSPQNVMISYAGEVKILDFGIAKAADSARTAGGQVKGKCEYMSPEQCRGEPLDRRSDIFSLGILLYELTAGKRLFKRDNAMLVFHAVCEAPIPRPTTSDPDYPRPLETICDRALARDRRDRYRTMLDMRRDLLAAIRQIAGADGRDKEHNEERDEEQLLSRIMTRLFVDRLQDKRDMLRRVQAGSPVARIPAAEADTEVELPEVPRASEANPGLGTGTTPSALHARTRRKRRVAMWGGAIVAVAVATAGAWLWFGGSSPDARVPCTAPASWPSTTSWVNLVQSVEGRAGPDSSCGVVGSSTPTTNPQYVWCRRWGGEVRRGDRFNHWWLWTDVDDPPSDGVRGWFPALYTQGQGNDEAKDNHSGRDIPDCP
jgi:serine/threonine protein kinase